ncbi:MAG TPA: gamma-glutamylcyclotransferase family protein [Chitinophagaceae bacterium]
MKNPGVYHLFVYGSLRSGFQSPAYEYISRFFTLTGDAKVRGKLFDMGSYPAAVPTTDDIFIAGELYIIKDESEFSWAIGQLDDYEGVNVESDEVQLYRRELSDVIVGDQKITAWMYWYNQDVSGRPEIVSGDVIEYLKNK